MGLDMASAVGIGLAYGVDRSAARAARYAALVVWARAVRSAIARLPAVRLACGHGQENSQEKVYAKVAGRSDGSK